MKDYKYIELVKNGTYEYVTRKIGKDGAVKAMRSIFLRSLEEEELDLLLEKGVIEVVAVKC